MDTCGLCGGTEGHPKTALCNTCGGDYWVQARDFTLPELDGYIAEACENLEITREILQKRVEKI